MEFDFRDTYIKAVVRDHAVLLIFHELANCQFQRLAPRLTPCALLRIAKAILVERETFMSAIDELNWRHGRHARFMEDCPFCSDPGCLNKVPVSWFQPMVVLLNQFLAEHLK
jgi:hypothetical protein